VEYCAFEAGHIDLYRRANCGFERLWIQRSPDRSYEGAQNQFSPDAIQLLFIEARSLEPVSRH
jgi:hypothetical protein